MGTAWVHSVHVLKYTPIREFGHFRASEVVFGHKYTTLLALPVCSLHVFTKIAIAHAKN